MNIQKQVIVNVNTESSYHIIAADVNKNDEESNNKSMNIQDQNLNDQQTTKGRISTQIHNANDQKLINVPAMKNDTRCDSINRLLKQPEGRQHLSDNNAELTKQGSYNDIYNELYRDKNKKDDDNENNNDNDKREKNKQNENGNDIEDMYVNHEYRESTILTLIDTKK